MTSYMSANNIVIIDMLSELTQFNFDLFYKILVCERLIPTYETLIYDNILSVHTTVEQTLRCKASILERWIQCCQRSLIASGDCRTQSPPQ
jgi:hypothetical protein